MIVIVIKLSKINLLAWLLLYVLTIQAIAQKNSVGLYRVFEVQLTNKKAYDNKFTDVELTASFTSPSGKVTDFFGFFDGDGKGGGDAKNGNIWKLRFMPDEPGMWS